LAGFSAVGSTLHLAGSDINNVRAQRLANIPCEISQHPMEILKIEAKTEADQSTMEVSQSPTDTGTAQPPH
jgi:hypothetical protein